MSSCQTNSFIPFNDFTSFLGSSLPTTPKLSSVNDHDELPLDIPELPDVPHFPHITEIELPKNQNLKDALERTDLPSPSQSNHIYFNNESPHFLEPTIVNSEMDIDSNEIPKIDTVEPSLQPDVCSNAQVKDFSSSSKSNSNDNVCRSESPPSLVFSAESLNCDDNQSEDFEEFHQNTEDVECNFPSLKLDSTSDTKSQSSDLEETNNSAECEIDEIRDNCEITNTTNSKSNFEVEFVKNIDTQSSNVDYNTTVTNTDDSFDDFVEYESNFTEPEKCDFVEYESEAAEKSHLSTQSKVIKDENVFAADFSQFEAFSENKSNETAQQDVNYQLDSDNTTLNQANTKIPSTLTDVVDDFNDFESVDDDDEFGEFNDFSDFSDFSQSQTFASTSLTTNVQELSAKIKPLLDNLFPSSDSDSEDGNYDALDLTNVTTKIIKDFENSKALDHQWTSSVGKSSLVTALGIDSRNIVSGMERLFVIIN